MNSYTSLNNSIPDIYELNYLILYRRRGIFGSRVYGYLVEKDDLSNISNFYNKRQATYVYMSGEFRTYVKHRGKNIGKIFNIDNVLNLDYEKTRLYYNKNRGNLNITIKNDEDKIILKTETKPEYELLDIKLKLKSVKNLILKDEDEENVFESIKIKKNIMIIASNKPINSLFAFVIGSKLFCS